MLSLDEATMEIPKLMLRAVISKFEMKGEGGQRSMFCSIVMSHCCYVHGRKRMWRVKYGSAVQNRCAGHLESMEDLQSISHDESKKLKEIEEAREKRKRVMPKQV